MSLRLLATWAWKEPSPRSPPPQGRPRPEARLLMHPFGFPTYAMPLMNLGCQQPGPYFQASARQRRLPRHGRSLACHGRLSAGQAAGRFDQGPHAEAGATGI